MTTCKDLVPAPQKANEDGEGEVNRVRNERYLYYCLFCCKEEGGEKEGFLGFVFSKCAEEKSKEPMIHLFLVTGWDAFQYTQFFSPAHDFFQSILGKDRLSTFGVDRQKRRSALMAVRGITLLKRYISLYCPRGTTPLLCCTSSIAGVVAVSPLLNTSLSPLRRDLASNPGCNVPSHKLRAQTLDAKRTASTSQQSESSFVLTAPISSAACALADGSTARSRAHCACRALATSVC